MENNWKEVLQIVAATMTMITMSAMTFVSSSSSNSNDNNDNNDNKDFDNDDCEDIHLAGSQQCHEPMGKIKSTKSPLYQDSIDIQSDWYIHQGRWYLQYTKCHM